MTCKRCKELEAELERWRTLTQKLGTMNVKLEYIADRWEGDGWSPSLRRKMLDIEHEMNLSLKALSIGDLDLAEMALCPAAWHPEEGDDD
jgi:hypothetical protein